MSTREIELAQPLLDEVTEWVKSGGIFLRIERVGDWQPYRFPDGEIPLQVVDVSEWYKNIDINNEDSRFVDLVDLTGEITGVFGLIHQFGPSGFEDFTSDQNEVIRATVIESQLIKETARKLHGLDPRENIQWEECLAQLYSTVLAHFHGIICSRAVSLSKRHAPMEALFYAYQQGLLPFGWDWESIICLDPNAIGTE